MGQFFKKISLFYVYEDLSTCIYMCHIYTWCPWRLEKEVKPPKQEVQMVVCHHMDAGIEPGSSAKAALTC